MEKTEDLKTIHATAAQRLRKKFGTWLLSLYAPPYTTAKYRKDGTFSVLTKTVGPFTLKVKTDQRSHSIGFIIAFGSLEYRWLKSIVPPAFNIISKQNKTTHSHIKLDSSNQREFSFVSDEKSDEKFYTPLKSQVVVDSADQPITSILQ